MLGLLLGLLVAMTPAGTVVHISTATGETLAFEPGEVRVDLRVRESQQVIIEFRNRSDLEHNLTFTGAITAATRTIVAPGSDDRLVIGPLAPGSYVFVCTIHEGMAGRLVVKPASTGQGA